MHGGVILFRGTGADARRYVEADRARADDYYLGADASVAQFTALDGGGNVTAALGLDPEAYAAWVDWVNPVTGESMGKPRLPGEGRKGSPRFAEMVVNAPKSPPRLQDLPYSFCVQYPSLAGNHQRRECFRF